MTTKPSKSPEHLRAATRRWYENVTESYELEPHHLRILQLAAESWDRGQEAREAIKTHGMTFENKYKEVKIRPEVTVERDCRTSFARLVRELALSEDDAPDPRRPPRLKYSR